MPAEVDYIVRSAHGDAELPNVPIMSHVFSKLREGLKQWPADKDWIVDIPSNRSIKLRDVEPNAYKIGSALTKLGMKHGDFVYFVTYELAQFFQVQVSVFLLGAAVRGCHPTDKISNFTKQINEVRAKFVIVDKESIDSVKEACKGVQHDIQFISVGEKVPGTINFEDLLQDDGSAFPQNVEINPEKDVALVINTSGSTGDPKGVVHTQQSVLAGMISLQSRMTLKESILESMTNYGVTANIILMYNLCNGVTDYHFTKFQKDILFENMVKYKPFSIFVYPHVAAWIAKLKDELKMLKETNFLRRIFIGGWVLDTASADALHEALPNTFIQQLYGMTETFCSTLSPIGAVPQKIERCIQEGKEYTSSGSLLATFQAKIIDISTKEALGPLKRGEILIKGPALMAGYLSGHGQPLNRSSFEADGWIHTGDLGFFDDQSNIYVLERLTFVYKHMFHFVSPAEVESLLLQHPDVLQVGVVGVPDPQSEALGRAFIVKRPGSKCSESDLVNFVAERAPFFKHLHKGFASWTNCHKDWQAKSIGRHSRDWLWRNSNHEATIKYDKRK